MAESKLKKIESKFAPKNSTKLEEGVIVRTNKGLAQRVRTAESKNAQKKKKYPVRIEKKKSFQKTGKKGKI